MPPGLSSAMTLKRVHREVADLKKEDLGAIVLAPSDDTLFLWKGSIPGPEGSVYEGGVFNFEVVLPPDYPFSAPKVSFKTRIYHMNISETGNICIDILKSNWSPALSLFKVMLSLSSLLTDPNPKDPLVPSIANQYTRNRKAHDTTARQWTELYARPKPPPPLQVVKPKGKQKSQVQPGASTSTSEPITVEDSDDDRPAATRGKRKRVEVSADVVLVADDDDDDDDAQTEARGSGGKRRAVGTGRTPRNSLGNSTEGSGSGRRGSLVQLGDVIVIEDD